MTVLIISIAIGISVLFILLKRQRDLVIWERDSQIRGIPIWTDDPINDRCEMFVSKESYEEKNDSGLAPKRGVQR